VEGGGWRGGEGTGEKTSYNGGEYSGGETEEEGQERVQGTICQPARLPFRIPTSRLHLTTLSTPPSPLSPSACFRPRQSCHRSCCYCCAHMQCCLSPSGREFPSPETIAVDHFFFPCIFLLISYLPPCHQTLYLHSLTMLRVSLEREGPGRHR
jgi:hypothetical protein